MSHNPFGQAPERYPKTQAAAAQFAAQMRRTMQRNQRTQVAIVVDATYHLAAGYVLCQTGSSIIHVYGALPGTLVAGMRIYCHRFNGGGTQHAYLFDSLAFNLSGLGTSGSVLYNTPITSVSTATPLLTSGVTTVASNSTLAGFGTGATGYYWHFFFFVPQLLTTPWQIWQMLPLPSGDQASSTLNFSYLPGGFLRFQSTDGHGYISTVPVAPHVLHWVLVQPGIAGAEMLIDGEPTYAPLIGTSDMPTILATTTGWSMTLLTNANGSNLLPLGTWISKVGFGTSYASPNPVPLTLPDGEAFPQQDSDLPNMAFSLTRQTQALYLCEDVVGSSSIANSAVGSAGLAPSLTLSSFAGMNPLGPY